MQAKVLDINQHSLQQDAELLHMFTINGRQEAAFNGIVGKYKERLYWHIRRMVVVHDDADDILQECFIKVWKYLPQFRQDSALYTWLYRIATNCALTFLDQKAKRKTKEFATDNEYTLDKLQTQMGFDANKIEWKLQLALAELPAKQKAVFNLRYYDEMPYEEMSEVLGTSVGALKASYHHAVQKITAYIKTN
jgi:RNA polymerase sigma factor (sigma-70 family)